LELNCFECCYYIKLLFGRSSMLILLPFVYISLRSFASFGSGSLSIVKLSIVGGEYGGLIFAGSSSKKYNRS